MPGECPPKPAQAPGGFLPSLFPFPSLKSAGSEFHELTAQLAQLQ